MCGLCPFRKLLEQLGEVLVDYPSQGPRKLGFFTLASGLRSQHP